MEILTPAFLYSIIKDFWARLRSRRRELTPQQVVALRAKWSPEFEEEINQNCRDRLSKDIIMHDMRRLNDYPDIKRNPKAGISPWFRAALVGTYHRGALIWLGGDDLVEDAGGLGWRYRDKNDREEVSVRAVLIGKMPYEFVESVNWKGDHYYIYPHIYCWFDARKRQPYEEIVYALEKKGLSTRPYYIDIASAQSVRRLSKKMKVDQYWMR